jgi:hypothetical protein
MRRSRIRPPTWWSIATAVDLPLLGFAMPFTRVSCLDQRIVARSLTRQRDKGRLIPTIQSSEGEIPRDNDSPLEGTGFEPSVPLARPTLSMMSIT